MLSASTRSQAKSPTAELISKHFAVITRKDHRGFTIRRIVGEGKLWISECVVNDGGKPVCSVSRMEFRDGKVSRETQYFVDPFNAPAWRTRWVARGSTAARTEAEH